MLHERVTLNTSEYWDLPWPERIEHVRGLGFGCIEASTQPEASAESFAAWLELIRQRGMAIAAMHDWYPFFSAVGADDQARMQARFAENIRRTAATGCGKLIWYTGDSPAHTGREAVAELRRRLEPLLELAARERVSLLLENEFSSGGVDLASSLDLLQELMQSADHPFLGVNLDPGNICTAGEEPFPAGYERLRPWIRHVHLKDVHVYDPRRHAPDLRLERGHRRITAPCPAGTGAVNLRGLLAALQRDGYQGFLSIEPHVRRQDLDMAVRAGLAFIRQAAPDPGAMSSA
jgi:sugar phosphate isomerase/epimerase